MLLRRLEHDALMGIREQILQGGAYLAARQIMGLAVRLGGVLMLTRFIGPAAYGLYAGPVAIVAVLAAVATIGTDAYLLTLREGLEERVYHQVFTFLLITTVTVALLGVIGSYALPVLLPDPRFAPPLRALSLTLPINVLWVPARARLERNYQYRRLAMIEFGGDIALYGPALLLAWAGLGVWAPVVGYAVWQAWLLVSTCCAAKYRPSLRWPGDMLPDLLRYGVGYSFGQWVALSRNLIYPFIVGRYVGAEGVGQVALALRLVNALAFARRITGRISIVTLTKVQDNKLRLRRAHEEGMVLQLLAIVTLLAFFSFGAPWVIPTVFGNSWDPTLQVFPMLALTVTLSGIFAMHESVFHSFGLNGSTIALHGARVGVSAAAAFALVPYFGVFGYGLASVVGEIGNVVADRQLRIIFAPRYTHVLLWLSALGPALFGAWMPWPHRLVLLVPLLMVLSLKSARQQVGQYILAVLSALKRNPNPP